MKICPKHPELNGERYHKAGRTGRCVGCAKETNKEWRGRNPEAKEKMDANKNVRLRARNKEAVYDHYGRCCAICGFDHPDAISIDHIDQNGAKHTLASGKRITGGALRNWLVRQGFPAGFRTLCMNCQAIEYAKHRRG